MLSSKFDPFLFPSLVNAGSQLEIQDDQSRRVKSPCIWQKVMYARIRVVVLEL
jgi:hypothetical protein